jgi:hypothetical protein
MTSSSDKLNGLGAVLMCKKGIFVGTGSAILAGDFIYGYDIPFALLLSTVPE